jgi:hypothetical protein
MRNKRNTQKPAPVQESVKSDVMASTALTQVVNDMANYRHQDHFYSLVSHITNTLSTTLATREFYFNELNNYRNNWLTNGIYDVIANDVFVDTGELDFLSVKCDKYPEVEVELTKLFKRLNFSSLLMSIFPEIVHNGSYYLRPIIKPGRGIIDIIDNLEPRAVIPIADSKGLPLMFFVSNHVNNRPSNVNGISGATYVQTENYSSKTAYEYYNISEIIQFSLDLSFIKLTIPDRLGNHLKRKAPDDLAKSLLPQTFKLRTSQSLIWPVIDKLKEVLLLDRLGVYRDIGSIMTPNLVGIPIPEVFDPEQAIAIVKKYDELLNSNVSKLNNTQNIEITLQELASVKVVPVIGDKSTPSVMDVGRSVPISSPETLASSIDRLLNSIGIPSELFSTLENASADPKDSLKRNIRYAKKIKRIQKNISRTITFICLLHISQVFPKLNVTEDDLNVQLKNNTNVDELENQEATDLMVSSISSVKDLVENLTELTAKSSFEIDTDELIKNIQASFISVGSKYHNIFKKRETPTTTTFTNENNENVDEVRSGANLDTSEDEQLSNPDY